MKGSFIGTVIKQSDLKSGTKDGEDWTMKKFTIEDATDSIELTAWGDEINRIKVGYKYEFTNLWWKTYKDSPTLAFGKFATIKNVGSAQIPTKDVAQEVIDKVETIEKKPLGDLMPMALEYVQLETIYLLQVETEVKKIMKEYGSDMDGGKIGMFTKEIYRKMSNVNFKIAGDGFSHD
jgi:hypothetical protein